MKPGDVVQYTGRFLWSIGMIAGDMGAKRFTVAECNCGLCQIGHVAVDGGERHIARAALRRVGESGWRDELRAADSDTTSAWLQQGIRRGSRKVTRNMTNKMQIVNHRLTGVDYKPAVDHGPKFKAGSPRYIILHYTAGTGFDSAVSTLTGKADPEVSAHVVVGVDGRLAQLVPFDTVAWHAGESEWHGLTGLNDYAIGIEMVNPGYAREGVTYAGPFVRTTHKHGGPVRDWYLYPDEQVARVAELVHVLLDAYPSILDVIGHDDVAPGRKPDPGPAWDWAAFRAMPADVAKASVPSGPKPVSDEDLANWFTYHPPTPDQQARYVELRAAALSFARTVAAVTPPSADQTAAIRKIREAVMTANAAIACEKRE